MAKFVDEACTVISNGVNQISKGIDKFFEQMTDFMDSDVGQIVLIGFGFGVLGLIALVVGPFAIWDGLGPEAQDGYLDLAGKVFGLLGGIGERFDGFKGQVGEIFTGELFAGFGDSGGVFTKIFNAITGCAEKRGKQIIF